MDENDIGRITIQIFEATESFGSEHTLCIFRSIAGSSVIEHNGDFYSCDHYVDKEHFIGNIKSSIAGFLDDEGRAFGRAKSLLFRYCRECNVWICAMANVEESFYNDPDGEPGLNYLCSAYKMFLTTAFLLSKL